MSIAADVIRLRPDISTLPPALTALLQPVGFVDPELLGHASRVVPLVSRTIDCLPGCTEQDRLQSVATALLHDVGKAGIPSGILQKRGPLTSTEISIVRGHAAIGANLVGIVLGDEVLAATIRHHHEWWNGDGYPAGLAGLRIPLASRVTGIADAFDAMTTDRPYRAARDVSSALEELRRCAGTQFDPELVQAFISAVSTG